MAISKIIYKANAQDTGTVWMDATPATAAAADITAPKTAMLADGILTTGTGSGGGGGLVYETGTWTPTEDVTSTTISFANNHTTKPMYVVLQDVTGDAPSSTNDNLSYFIANFNDTFGRIKYTSSAYMYGRMQGGYGSSFTGSSYNTVTTLENVLSGSSFNASTNSSSRYWKAGRTYKWIAVWAPST